MNFNPFAIFQQGMQKAERHRQTRERLYQYGRNLRAYQGFSVRGIPNTNIVRDWKRLKFNFTKPVVNLSAGWLAAKPIDWSIEGDADATAAAYAIWERSGSDACLLESAILCGIYGDLVGLATQDEDGKAKIEFVDPSISMPTFSGSDYQQLVALEFAYQGLNEDGSSFQHREMWGVKGMEVYENDALTDSRAYDLLPAVWIRNTSIKGLPFGESDVEPILDLVEEYDHIASKQTRIVDYYASPHVWFTGTQKPASGSDMGMAKVYYLATGEKCGFLEWQGSGPSIEDQLTRIRNAIAEISQVPAVAFGQADSGLTSISGVAIKILYGPLQSKTHRKQSNWRPALQYLMWRCLVASGYPALKQEDVECIFPDGTPVDGQERVAESSARVASRLSSRRTEMENLGIEDPDAELKKIVIEEKILQLVTPAPVLGQDANVAAKAGARGMFAAETPAGVGVNKAQPGQPGMAQPTVGDTTSTNDDDIAHLIERFDALIEMENQSLDQDDPEPDDKTSNR